MAGRWPQRVVRGAVLALPRGPIRDRYRRELLADLAALDPMERTRFVLGVVAGVVSLRRASSHLPITVLEEVMTAPRKPFLCRTNLRHRWEWAKTSDGVAFVRCSRCHKERGSGLDDGRATTANVISSIGGIGH